MLYLTFVPKPIHGHPNHTFVDLWKQHFATNGMSIEKISTGMLQQMYNINSSDNMPIKENLAHKLDPYDISRLCWTSWLASFIALRIQPDRLLRACQSVLLDL